jgi:AraC-like DNA-binding protein
MEFLARVRLARAAQLLAATELPVKMVAGRVGYLSRSSFTRAFLARHGVGPRAYRAAGRAGDRQSGRSPLTVRPLRGKTRVSAPPSGAIARDWNDRTPEAVSF